MSRKRVTKVEAELKDLMRLLSARTLAVVGGGTWCDSIIGAAQKIGFTGKIFPVHPAGKNIAGLRALKSLNDWDGPIDGAFIGVNRHATLDVLRQLNDLNAGGAVCFASGFAEAASEEHAASDLQAELVRVAGQMPILGPNCYGFVNALDRVALWPDQHGMTPVDSGVAILTQSSNIAINLSMQKRGLPIAYMITCGNQAQTSQANIAASLLEDPRVTAVGLHIEGFGHVDEWVNLAMRAQALGKTLVALKVGRSQQAQNAALSHTASLAGSDAGASALLKRLGILRVDDLTTFLETLKLLHVTGNLDAPTVSSISCSGGEASLMADLIKDQPLTCPPLNAVQETGLRDALGPMVALANPLDYHTYIWRDTDTMAAAWSCMAAPHIGITLSVVDYPHTDAAHWECATNAALETKRRTGRPVGVVASLPELMPEDTASQLMSGGVIPFNGMQEALRAVACVSTKPKLETTPPLAAPALKLNSTLLTEAEAKTQLAAFGVSVPKGKVYGHNDLDKVDLQGPLVVKSMGLAHKSEAGAVKLNIASVDIPVAVRDMPGTDFLIEQMVQDAIVELIVGVVRDPAHGFVLTLGAGGVLTEILQDTVSLLLPTPTDQIQTALETLNIWPLLNGYRGKVSADVASVLSTVQSVQDYVLANADTIEEVEINPLICTRSSAVAADALIRKG